MKNVIIVGGGASGLMAAYASAARGNKVILLEKNEKLGKKIYITGKGRCNLTNDCSPEEFLQNVVRGKKFLTGSAYSFPAEKTIRFMEEHGLNVKVERGNRVFPVSDHASDVTATLERACRNVGVSFKLNEPVTDVLIEENTVTGIQTALNSYRCEAAIIATGGISYPATGSTGDGYRFARKAGHRIIDTVPSLVGLETFDVLSSAQGVTLKNVVLTAKRFDKVIFSALGEVLITHYGISGPLVLSLSAEINRIPLKELTLAIDFKPALSEKELDSRLIRDFTERKNEQMKNVMRGLLPASLIPYVLKSAQTQGEVKANSVTREMRTNLIRTLKKFVLSPKALRGFSEAVVTSGGVDLSEVNPKTMESKKIKGLYFCGEVLDVDAYTGGFNLQIAFSTGYLAGNAIS